MEKLAIFDVDYTLTKRETLVELYLFMLRFRPSLIKYVLGDLRAAFLYLFKIYDEKKAKESFISFIDGIKEEDMQNIVKDFYEKRLSKIIRKDAIDMMKKLKGEGYKIFLISASPEFYLKELYNIKEVDKVIGTRIKIQKGLYKHSIEGSNCKGQEKIHRLMEVLKEENIQVDFKNSYMFSDSLSDRPLFDLVGKPYLINYKGHKTAVESLRWK